MARQQKQVLVAESVPAAPVKSLFERLAGYLDANDWTYSANEEKQYFTTDFNVKAGKLRVILDVAESENWQRVLVYSIFPVFVPEHRRAAVAESICKINYTLIFGNLELDPSDGEIRFRSIVESDGALSDSMIARALASNLDMTDQFFAPLLAVAFANTAPEKVLDLVVHNAAETVQ